MEIVPMSLSRAGDTHSLGLPFNRRNVEEWSRLDKLTGMMEKTKIETDHWSASNSHAAHNYGKVVDSRERNLPDGSLQQRQRKQMEIFQTSVPGGSMQVIRTQTVTSSSSSSHWSSSTGKAFDELQLPVNSLDLSSQKTKGSVGRSGSIGTRRPPSRPRSLAGMQGETLSDVVDRCRQLHENAKARMFRGFTNGFDSQRPESPGGVVITELDSPNEPSERKNNLSRQKSCSNENINEESEENNSIRRTSWFRRSLQIPKTSITDDIPDWTNGKSLKERAAEIENLLRRGSTLGAEIKREEEKETAVEKPAKTKSSFVTAETLKEVRERLRKSSNSDNDFKDEGIVTESSSVRDVVSDMEAKLGSYQKPLVNGTGSLETRRSHLNHTSEWLRRRKSYGFENVEESNKNVLNGYDDSSSTSKDFNSSNGSFSKLQESPFKRYIEEPSLSEAAWTRKSPLPSRERSSLRCTKNPWISQLRGTKLVDRQWFNDTPDPEQNDSGVPDSPKEKDDELKVFEFDLNKEKKHKKVEFCKTEVHFAVDSGRVNIVETDGKPPPNHMVRRRRRNSGPYITSENNNSGLPEFKFGDTLLEQKLLTTPTNAEKIDSLRKKIENELNELSKIVVDAIPVKEEPINKHTQNLPNLYDVAEEQTDPNDLSKPRSILKSFNKNLDETEDLTPVWKSTVILRNKRFEDIQRTVEDRKSYSSDGESELQIRFRNLKKPVNQELEAKVEPITVEIKRRSLPDDVLLSAGLRLVQNQILLGEDSPRLSVAERIKQVEEFKKNTYSSKIDFRSGEMTVLQNGTTNKDENDNKKEGLSWSNFSRSRDRSSFHSDSMTNSNPPMRRFPTDQPNTTTTRISINIPFERSEAPAEKYKSNTNNKPCRSWSFDRKAQPFSRLQSTSLVMNTIHGSEILKPTRPVHEMINKFDSLSRISRRRDPERRRTMPINYKAPKEYTHADLEEDLRNFTEDLDKDFKDIYEEEIGSLKGSCKDLKNAFDKVCEASEPKSMESKKHHTLPLMGGLRRIRSNGFQKYTKTANNLDACNGYSVKSHLATNSLPRISRQKSPSRNYDSDDSDLLADEEVRSYMSTGQGDSDSEFDEPFQGRKKCFERIRLQFKRLEESYSSKRPKETKIQAPIKPTLVHLAPKESESHYAAPPKVASIALRYEDDPLFKTSSTSSYTVHDSTDRWEKVSNSSSNMSDQRPRERVSYLNGPSLSEKYSNKASNSSLDNLFEVGALSRVKELQDTLRSSFRSEGSVSTSSFAATARLKDVKKIDLKKVESVRPVVDAKSTLDELSRTANEILVAVNGLTDDDSLIASSEEDDISRRIIKKGKMSSLTTISEGKKITNGITSADGSKKITKEKPLSSRATRLMQRASNRDAMMPQVSSSEDIPANVEPVKKKLVRKPRILSVKKDDKDKEKEKEDTLQSKVKKVRSRREETCKVQHREREKTVSSAAKEVKRNSTKTYQLPSDTRLVEQTKPKDRRDLLSQADAAAEQSIRKKRSTISCKTTREEASITKGRSSKVNLRKVEATRVSQAV